MEKNYFKKNLDKEWVRPHHSFTDCRLSDRMSRCSIELTGISGIYLWFQIGIYLSLPSFIFLTFKMQIKYTWDITLLLKHLPISYQWNFSLEMVLLLNLHFGTLLSWESIRQANNYYEIPTFFKYFSFLWGNISNSLYFLHSGASFSPMHT